MVYSIKALWGASDRWLPSQSASIAESFNIHTYIYIYTYLYMCVYIQILKAMKATTSNTWSDEKGIRVRTFLFPN